MVSEVKLLQPRLRFVDFHDDWTQQRIGSILTDISRPVQLLDNELYQLVTVKRRNEGVVPRSVVKGKNILVKNYFAIKAGDFLISKRQVVHGANGIVPESLDNAVVSNEYLVVTDNQKITAKFWSTISKRPEIKKLYFISSYGVDIEKLVFDIADWKERSILIPELNEQQKITDFFQNLDQQIKLHQDKHNKLQQLKQAMLGKMFTKTGENVPEVRFSGFSEEWQRKTLGDITSSFSGGTPAVGVHEYYGGDIPFIRSGEINSSQTALFITQEGLANSSAKVVNVGCILYALYGATSGEVAISKINGAINQAILAMHPKNGYSAKFIALWLLREKQEITSSFLQGGQGNLSGSIIKNLAFDFPNYEEQEKIGEYFQNLDNLIALQQQKINKLKNIRLACLEKMFV
ncbi:restriction endonuclease subunit S [Vibrio cholerae]|nr:restriction endonuclease subunit S [Vibrio cholerae]